MLESSVELEMQLGDRASCESTGGTGPQKAGCTLQTLDGAGFLGLFARDTDHDPRVRKIVGHQHGGHGDEADPGIADLAGKRVGDDLPEGLTNLFWTAR